MPSSLGKAIPSTPAFRAKTSVTPREGPLGLMQPNSKGVSGNIKRANAMTLAISVEIGAGVFAMAVPRMGMKAIMTMAEGLTWLIILSASNSPSNLPSFNPTITCGTKGIPDLSNALSDST